MSASKVAISLEPELLQRIDVKAAEIGVSRSAFVRQSMEFVLNSLEDEHTVREARALYSAIEDTPEAQRLQEAFAGISYETVPPFTDVKSQLGGRSG
jgi:metal-responsive CopG/Arc/MetJ family transcriptional regulator